MDRESHLDSRPGLDGFPAGVNDGDFGENFLTGERCLHPGWKICEY